MLNKRHLAIGCALLIVSSALAQEPAIADAPFLGVAPSMGLVDNQVVSVAVSGLPVSALGKVYIAQCANAESDGTPLPTIDPNTDCEISTWIEGTAGPNGTVPLTVHETGIGTADRSCVTPAVFTCYVYTPYGINTGSILPTPVDIVFGGPSNALPPVATTTTITPMGSPISSTKTPHVYVQVSAPGLYIPYGNVTVSEGLTTLASGTVTNGIANIALPPLSPGPHQLFASFAGNDAFLPSGSGSAAFDVVGARTITISDAATVNGSGGTRAINFPVVLSGPPPTTTLKVRYDIVNGTATAGVDFLSKPLSGTLTFRAGTANSRLVNVKLMGTLSTGGSKQFTVVLSNPQGDGFEFRRSVATGTIIDPTAGGPTVNIASGTSPEGDTGNAHLMKFNVTLSATQLAPVKVLVHTLPGSADGTDFVGTYSKMLTFLPGIVNKSVSIKIKSDLTNELDESFTVRLISITQTTTTVQLGSSTATGTILSDE